MTSFAALEKIANAVLYEGFLLYPYRKSSVENTQRWHFGTLGPNGCADPSMMQTQCLIETGAGCRIKEAPFRLPSSVWREMMDLYYPNSTWLRLRRDTFDRLHDYKHRSGMATWEEAIESLLPAGKKQAAS